MKMEGIKKPCHDVGSCWPRLDNIQGSEFDNATLIDERGKRLFNLDKRSFLGRAHERVEGDVVRVVIGDVSDSSTSVNLIVRAHFGIAPHI